MDNELPIVMILGCGRSGTSIFSELFDGLNGYVLESEMPFVNLINADHSVPRAYKVPRESSGYPVKPGLSVPIDVLLDFPKPVKFFWMVRHPLDAICSLKVGIAKNWGHHPQPPDWRDWLSRPLVEQCAHHWDYLNSRGYEQVEGLAKVMRFEELIGDPAAFAADACRHVGLDTEANREHIDTWARRVQNSNNEHFVEAEVSRPYSRPDHSVRVERWRENLSREEAQVAWSMVSRTASTFGYDVRF